MKYKTGDKVVHPEHGPGIIQAYFRLGLNGLGQLDYIIAIPHQHAEVRVAGDEIDRIGLRRLMRTNELLAAMAIMLRPPEPWPKDFSAHQCTLDMCLAGLHAHALAIVARDLSFLFNTHPSLALSTDEAALNRARTILSAKWALAADLSYPTAALFVDKQIANAAQYWPRS